MHKYYYEWTTVHYSMSSSTLLLEHLLWGEGGGRKEMIATGEFNVQCVTGREGTETKGRKRGVPWLSEVQKWQCGSMLRTMTVVERVLVGVRAERQTEHVKQCWW